MTVRQSENNNIERQYRPATGQPYHVDTSTDLHTTCIMRKTREIPALPISHYQAGDVWKLDGCAGKLVVEEVEEVVEWSGVSGRPALAVDFRETVGVADCNTAAPRCELRAQGAGPGQGERERERGSLGLNTPALIILTEQSNILPPARLQRPEET